MIVLFVPSVERDGLTLIDQDHLAELNQFCRTMGRETNQGEIGLVIDNEYLAIVDFGEG